MMNFLPQGYSFESYSNPYQSQFVSPYYGSGQYGWQYSPMAQPGPRLPTCEPGTCPPWLPPGIVATTSSGVQELSVLFDPTLAARMATAYNPWSVPRWGKPDNPAWMWPSGAARTPVPPNVLCDVIPGSVPQGSLPPGGTGPGREPVPAPAPPTMTPRPTTVPTTMQPKTPTMRPGPAPRPTAPTAPTPATFVPPPSGSALPNPERVEVIRGPQTTPLARMLGRLTNRGRTKTRTGRAQSRRLSRVRRSAQRRGTPEPGWSPVPGGYRGWCGPGEYLCTKKTPSGKSNFCCCRDGTNKCSGGKIVLALSR